MNWAVRLLGAACALCALAAASSALASDMAQDAAIWRTLRESLFGDRPIAQDLNGEVISLRAPARAQDAATVPVSIISHLESTPARHVERIYLIIDQNPSPVAGAFTFTPDSGRAHIETRVRIEEYSQVRAVAELSDGTLYTATRFVKAAGGCSSPTGTAPDLSAFVARVRLRTDGEITWGESNVAQLMIQHPNTSGLARDQLTQLYIPAYFVRAIQVSYAGRPILTAEVNFSISENPSFRFHFVPHEPGELEAVVVDTRERRWEGRLKIIPAAAR